MNLRLFLVIIAILAVLTWLFGNGFEKTKKKAPKMDMLGNTHDAVKGAAQQLSQ